MNKVGSLFYNYNNPHELYKERWHNTTHKRKLNAYPMNAKNCFVENKGEVCLCHPVIKLRARRKEKSYELIPFIRLLDFVSPEMNIFVDSTGVLISLIATRGQGWDRTLKYLLVKSAKRMEKVDEDLNWLIACKIHSSLGNRHLLFLSVE